MRAADLDPDYLCPDPDTSPQCWSREPEPDPEHLNPIISEPDPDLILWCILCKRLGKKILKKENVWGK